LLCFKNTTKLDKLSHEHRRRGTPQPSNLIEMSIKISKNKNSLSVVRFNKFKA